MSTTTIDAAIEQIAAEQGTDTSRTDLNRISAQDLDIRTGYKVAGLSAAHIRDRIYAEWERQQEVRAERRARKPAAPPTAGRILRLLEQKRRNLEQTAREFARCTSLLEAQRLMGQGQTRIGDIIFRGVEEGRWNNARYSRSWHRQHGGVWEVSERRVEMLRVNRLGAPKVVGSVRLESFRGHWLIRAVVELLGLEKVRVPRELKPVQMGDYFEVEHLRSLAGVEVYRRTLAGAFVDYCVVARGETYHAETLRAAVEGVRDKLAARERADTIRARGDDQRLTAESGRKLGFCEAGMREFCDYNGLSFYGSYTRGQLRQVVSERQEENLSRWGTELRRAGIA